MATITRTISTEIVKKDVIRVTNIDELEVIRLPRSVFSVRISTGDTPLEYKRFLCIEYHRHWVDRQRLTNQIVKSINRKLGEGFIDTCRNCTQYYIGLHYSYDPNAEVYVKKDEENYIIFTRKTTTEDKVEYKKLF